MKKLCLTIYLGLRGFWVGILGLSSVYPDGINIKKLNFNDRFTNDLKKYNFIHFIINIDNICSSIFAFTFLLSFSIISLLILTFEILGVIIFGVMLSEQFKVTGQSMSGSSYEMTMSGSLETGISILLILF